MADATAQISILLPTYNGEPFLAKQLDSILRQTRQDFELIVMDDGSRDATLSILRDYAGRDGRIRLLPSEGNRGQKLRLLEMLGSAGASLIAVSDQDDIWHDRKLERLSDRLGDAAVAFGRSELIDREGRSQKRDLLDFLDHPPEAGDRLSLLFQAQVSGHAMLARRDVITEMAFRRLQHYDWLISLDAKFTRGTVYDSDAIVYHRIHGGNQCNTAALDKYSIIRRIRPRILYKSLGALRRSRFSFVERLEHLAFSTVVDDSTRNAFQKLAVECRSTWFDPADSGPFAGERLRKTLMDGLEPFAGSKRDWDFTVDRLGILTLGRLLSRATGRSVWPWASAAR